MGAPAASRRRTFALALRILASVAVLAGLYVYVVAPLLEPDEARLARITNEVVESAGKRGVAGILDPVADDYRDAFHTSRSDLRRSLMHLYLSYPVWRVDVVEPPRAEIAPDGKTAVVTLRARVRLGRDAESEPIDDRISPLRGTDLYRVRYALRDGRWKIVSTDGGDEEKIGGASLLFE